MACEKFRKLSPQERVDRLYIAARRLELTGHYYWGYFTGSLELNKHKEAYRVLYLATLCFKKASKLHQLIFDLVSIYGVAPKFSIVTTQTPKITNVAQRI